MSNNLKKNLISFDKFAAISLLNGNRLFVAKKLYEGDKENFGQEKTEKDWKEFFTSKGFTF